MAMGGLINLPAVLIIGLLTGILILGAKESTRVNAAIVLANIAVIVIFIVVGLKYINPANYTPFTPFGIAGIFQGAAMVFFAYIGFDAVSTAAEEAKDPQKNLPMGIIGSLIISSILYIVVAAVLTGMVPYKLLNNAAPVAFALQYVGFQLDSFNSICWSIVWNNICTSHQPVWTDQDILCHEPGWTPTRYIFKGSSKL